MSYNLFAYCKNNPVAFQDPAGCFGVVAGVAAVIATGAIVGGLLGAFSAATTGGNILESVIEGVLIGAIGASCGLFISNPIAAITIATIGGSAVDFGVQASIQYITKKQMKFSEIDYGRVVKTGMQTGMGTAIPQYGQGPYNAVDTFGTALIWAEASTIITCADVVITNSATTPAGQRTASNMQTHHRTSTSQYVVTFAGGKKLVM